MPRNRNRVSYSKELRALDDKEKCGLFTLEIISGYIRNTVQGALNINLLKLLNETNLKLDGLKTTQPK